MIISVIGRWWLRIIGLVLFAGFCICRARKLPQLMKYILLGYLLPIGGYLLLWRKHVDLVFDSDKIAWHSVTKIYYSLILSEKSENDIVNVLKKFFARAVTFENKDIRILVIIILILFLCYVFHRKGFLKKSKKYCHYDMGMIAAGLGIYAMWQFSLMFMYVFSMPQRETINLAGYSCLIILYLYFYWEW